MRASLGLLSHEKECALRYSAINDTMASIKNILLIVGVMLIGGMASILVNIVFFK